MDHAKVIEIAEMLQLAARREKLVPYQRLHALFESNYSLENRYQMLEGAARMLCDPALADYGCLMALANGLPGSDFFLRFKRLRRAEFEEAMGFASLGRSTTKQRQLANSERKRVYQHAALASPSPRDRFHTAASHPVLAPHNQDSVRRHVGS